MRPLNVNLNLASHPFGRTRLLRTLSVCAAVLLLGLSALLVRTYLQNHELSPAQVKLESSLRAQLNALRAEEVTLRNKLQEPGNDQVLARSLFLNELLYRKGISWTRTFADLETILPPRVRMALIRPEVTPDNKVQLDMQVAAETPQDFIDFFKALESSEWFSSPSLRSWNPPTENEPAFRYQLTVSYDQQL